MRVVVQSQIVRSIGFAAAERLLEIEFQNGWVYQYDDVPAAVYRALMAAESHGRYLHRHIVDQFPTRRIS